MWPCYFLSTISTKKQKLNFRINVNIFNYGNLRWINLCWCVVPGTGNGAQMHFQSVFSVGFFSRSFLQIHLLSQLYFRSIHSFGKCKVYKIVPGGSCILFKPLWSGGEMGFDKGMRKITTTETDLITKDSCFAKVGKLGNELTSWVSLLKVRNADVCWSNLKREILATINVGMLVLVE